MDEDLYNDSSDLAMCPKCGRSYTEDERDFQSCKKCGWDAERNSFGKRVIPTEDDFLNGDADILTGRWL